MDTYIKLIIFIALIITSSCKSNKEDINNEPESTTIPEESISNAFTKDTTPKKHEIVEQKENLKQIEKKYGAQWDFCQCVIANDSIDKAVKKTTNFETPEAERLLERFEFVSNKCQAFLGMDANKTPEEREKHAKKVKKCLSEAKR